MPSSRWLAAMAVARRAPSLHNGQHFHLVVDMDEPDVAIVRFERARGVPVGDSTGRFLFVALGAFLDSLQIALAADGHASDDELMCHELRAPYTARSDTYDVARIRIGGALAPEAQQRAAITRGTLLARQTNRKRFTGDPIPEGVVDGLAQRLAAARGVTLSHTTDAESVRWIVRHNCRTLFVDLEDDDLRRELESLIRFSSAASNASRDGLAASTFGFPGPLLRLFFKLHDISTRRPLRDALMRVYEHSSGGASAVIWLRSPFSTAAECVACGRALLDLWLDLTSLGIAFQPYGSLITNEPMCAQLLDRLGEPAASVHGEIWLAARVGYAPRGPESLRRATADLVRLEGSTS